MKRKSIATLILFVAAVVITHAVDPEKTDWRYVFRWDDPNTSILATNYTVYASNNVPGGTVRIAETREKQIDLKAFLNGAPAGVFSLTVNATSELGDVSEPSPEKLIFWPGGNGKIKSPGNPHVNK